MTKVCLQSNRIRLYSLLCCAVMMIFAACLAAQTDAKPASAATPASSSAQATAPAVSNLTIKIKGIRNAKGRINIALYRDGKGFPTDISSAVAAQRIEIDPQTLSATAVFKDLPQGSYAAAVLHDEDLTGKMDYDAQGIPQKGYGLSNNPDTTQGPPTPEEAIFVVNQPESAIEIKLTYWN